MRRSAGSGFLAFVTVLIVAGLAITIGSNLERVEIERTTDSSDLARQDPYLALGRWARQQEIEYITARDQAILPHKGGALIVDSHHVPIESKEQIRTWIERGGRLTIVLNDPSSTAFKMLSAKWRSIWEAAGLLVEPDLARPQQSLFGAMFGGEDAPSGDLRLDELQLTAHYSPPSGAVISTDLNADVRVELADDGRPVLLSASLGAGRVTLMGEPVMLQNDFIGREDNATLAWYLMGEGTGTLLIDISEPDLLLGREIVDNLWVPIVGLAAVVVLLFLRARVRLDSPLEIDPPPGASVGDRIAGDAHFLWHYRQSAALLLPLQRRILRRAGIPYTAGDIDDGQLDVVTARLGIDRVQVARVFTEQLRAGDRRQFTEIVRLAKSMEDNSD